MSFGGGASGGGSQQQSTGGFQALSPEIQQSFNQLATTAAGYIPGTGSGGSTSNAYTPLPQTAGETQALNTINQGFTPNQQQFTNSVNMQMNPYDQNVINRINKNAYGQNSMLQGQLAQAGQFGSNRAALGANDIANSQADTIGSILNPEYNTAVQNALTTIPQLNASSASAQLQGGAFQRQLAGQTAQAPTNALAAISQILGILPTNSSQSTGGSSQSSGQGQFNLFSDRRLKENIIEVGEQNGFRIYQFNYKGGSRRFIGAMADEVAKRVPQAVGEKDGYKTVDYARIGVRLREIA